MDTPASHWLRGALRAEILAGRLRPGSRLPATRDLARQYSVARGTIVAVFEQLQAEGFLVGTVGSGTRVNSQLPAHLLRSKGAARPAPRPPPRRVAEFGRTVRRFDGYSEGHSRAFRAHVPALDLFPARLWSRLTARRLRNVTTSHLLGCAPLGFGPLREVIADHLASSRGVRCEPDQVAIVSGVQDALDLVARLFLDRGDTVAMEDPGYPGAARVFESLGARIADIPVDAEGMEVPSMRVAGARLVYVTPGHQFPLGVAMSLARRLALLAWARKERAMIFEDDYDGEYRYTARPVPALQGLDPDGLVLFAGSFSKVLFPSLRLGYLVLPPDLVERVAAVISITSRHAALLEQVVLADFIADGHYARHLRRMRDVYAGRLATLRTAAEDRWGERLRLTGLEAGLQITGKLGAGLDEAGVARAAADRGVEVIPIGRYTRGRHTRQALQLGFGAVGEKEILRGVEQLGVALDLAGPRGGRTPR
jgi:GntR family transcriptional regulator/MocR family aminotransferase